MNNRFKITSLGKAPFQSTLEQKEHFIDGLRVLNEIRLVRNQDNMKINPDEDSFEKSGPRSKIYFNPQRSKAAIVTCGGLCPGMNAVVRGIVRQLYNRYFLTNVVGVRYGYKGLGKDGEAFIPLTPTNTEDIHHDGGTILGTSRGAPPVSEMVDSLQQNNINMLFTVGGDGTMKGAHALHKEIEKRGLKIAVIGVPKTIDNDIPFVNLSFGFETAVEKASEVVLAGHEEARGHFHGIGLVKLMGRSSGFIAAGTTMATGVVNICLVPEVKFTMESLMKVIKERFNTNKHILIVVAEGAGDDLIQNKTDKVDQSGNPVLSDIGLYLKDEISAALKKENCRFSLKYLDPSYLIRSAGPNSFDKVFCARLAQNAVHAAMAGKTDMLVGYWHGEMTHVPLAVIDDQPKRINPKGTYWFNVLESTTQNIARF